MTRQSKPTDTPLLAETPRLMAVHAHPDDESSKGGAALARYAAEGADVLVVTCTGGERGDVLNPALVRPEVRRNLAEIRRREMAAASAILGVRQRFLGFVDSGLPADGEQPPADGFARQPLDVASERLVAEVREFRPHVIVTYDESGGYPHPDHIRTHEVAVEAFQTAGDPQRYPDAGKPWRPRKLYYLGSLSRAWFQVLHNAMPANARCCAARATWNEPCGRRRTTTWPGHTCRSNCPSPTCSPPSVALYREI